MQRISRAPVLSATRSRVSGWITGAPRRSEWRSSSSTLQDLDQPPVLGAAEWAGLDHAHGVALVRVVALVVRVQHGGLADDLLVGPVAAGHVDPHGDGLVRLGRDHHPLTHLRLPGPVLLGRDRGRRGALLARRTLLLALALPVAAASRGVLAPPLLALLLVLLDRLLVRHRPTASGA